MKIPQEIDNYYNSTEISSNMNAVTNMITLGAKGQYVCNMSDSILKQIGNNTRVHRTLRECSSNTRRFFSLYYSDAPLMIMVKSWAHEYARYLYSLFGRDKLERLSNGPAENRRTYVQLANNARDNAVEEYLAIRNRME
jgi:hypothetical protein